MDDDVNPYAAPQTESPLLATLAGDETEAVWREGRSIVIPRGASLPARCWRCNSSAVAAEVKCQLAWFPPIYLVLLLLGVVPLLILLLFVQRKATICVYLCERHARRRKTAILVAWLVAAVGLTAIIAGGVLGLGPLIRFLIWGGVVLLAAGLIGALAASGLATPRRIDKEAAWVRGAGSPFLNSLPDDLGRAAAASS
jgi:hypothetical protein